MLARGKTKIVGELPFLNPESEEAGFQGLIDFGDKAHCTVDGARRAR